MARLDTYGPSAALSWLERLPVWQAGAVKGMSLFAIGNLPRGAVLLHRIGYVADTASTTDADPGAGNVRWNNATQAAATVIYIDDADAAAGDHSALWATVANGGYLYLANQSMSVRQVWQVSTVTGAAGYVKFGVSLVAASGSFSDNDSLELSLQQPGAASGNAFVNIMLSNMSTALATGTKNGMWIAPEAGTLVDLWLAVDTQSSSGIVRVDMNNSAGTSMLSTRPAIDASENNSLTGTAAVLTGTLTFAKGDKFTFDIDDAGTGAKGLQCVLEYTPA